MSNSGTDVPTETIALNAASLHKDLPGFLKLSNAHTGDSSYAKTLASAYMKFTEQGNELSEHDSVQSFIALSELHRTLTEDVQEFLKSEVTFVYNGQQLQPLLLNFAAYLLKQVSRRYYFAVLQNQPRAILDDLKEVIGQRQAEYDALLQNV